MSLKKKSIAFLSLLSLISASILFGTFTSVDKLTQILDTALPQKIASLNQSILIKYYADKALYYDEVLTGATLNYTFTGKERWKKKYDKNEILLNEIINKALKAGNKKDKKNIMQLSKANQKLVALERDAFELAGRGQNRLAQEILEGEEYGYLKDFYLMSLQDYLLFKDKEINHSLNAIQKLVNTQAEMEKATAASLKTTFLIFVFLLLGFTWLIIAGFSTLWVKRLYKLKQGTKKIEKGYFDYRLEINSRDEFGQLALAFNKMAEGLDSMQKKLNKAAILKRLEQLRDDFSRELHDNLGIVISSLKLHLFNLDPNVTTQATNRAESYDICLQLLDESYLQIRELSANPIPGALIERGLKVSIQKLILRTELTFKVKIDFITNFQEKDIKGDDKASIYSLTRELLNNAIIHGKCKHINFQIIVHASFISLMFEDDGVGFSVKSLETTAGKGIQNIKSRVNEMEGSVFFDSNTKTGTTVTIEIPQNITVD
jgi:signal transduction histidine kinase